MTLDATKPTNEDFTSTYAAYERETRAQVNQNILDVAAAGATVTVSSVTVNGSTTLVTGTDVNAVPVEVVILTATGVETLNNITGGTEGQLKLIWLLAGTLTFAHDATKFSNDGDLDFAASTGDVIMYVNKNGDGAGTDGYWHEVFRNVRS